MLVFEGHRVLKDEKTYGERWWLYNNVKLLNTRTIQSKNGKGGQFYVICVCHNSKIKNIYIRHIYTAQENHDAKGL